MADSAPKVFNEKEDFTAGVFLVDKPAGVSSFAVVAVLRRILGIKKVGHAGTLDPFATGLLVVCAGRAATRLISSFMDGKKEYLATVCLGIETTTHDPEGDIVAQKEVGSFDKQQVEHCLAQFRGKIWQKPPAYSALKYKGKPLYHYARKGIIIEKEPRPVEITALERCTAEPCDNENPELSLRIECSKGTYIRVLAADIGRELGCGGHLTSLRRTRSGIFSVENALDWQELKDENARQHCLQKMLSVEEVVKLLQ